MKTETLQQSKYLKIIERPEKNDYIMYHSLFGGLCSVDNDILSLINYFEKPSTIEDLKTQIPAHLINDIDAFINRFIDKKFLSNPKVDEYDIVQDDLIQRNNNLKSGKQIKVIQLVVSNLCNFRCKYCFVDSIYSSKERLEYQEDRNNKVMDSITSKNAIDTVISKIKSAGNTNLSIQFFGGEPLTNWKTIKFVLDNYGNGENDGINISYSIVTNGSLINEEIADYFNKNNVSTIVSFDTPKDTNRLQKNGHNSIVNVEKSLTLLKQYNCTVIFNASMVDENFHIIDTDLIDFALKYNVKEIGVLFDLNPEFYIKYSPDEIIEKLWKLYTYAKANQVVISGYWFQTFIQMMETNTYKQKGFKTCSATGAQFSIEPNGSVFACKGSSAYFGDINNVDEIFSSKSYLNYSNRTFRNAIECKDCEIENFCSGICPGSLEKKYRDINKIEENACNVYKGLIKKLINELDINLIESYSFK